MRPTLRTLQGHTNAAQSSAVQFRSSGSASGTFEGLPASGTHGERPRGVCGNSRRCARACGCSHLGVRGRAEKRQRGPWKAPSQCCPNPAFPHVGTQESYLYASPGLLINRVGGTPWKDVSGPTPPSAPRLRLQPLAVGNVVCERPLLLLPKLAPEQGFKIISVPLP